MHSKLSSDDVAYGKMPSWYAPVSNAKFVIYVTQTLLGDGFMVSLVVEIDLDSVDENHRSTDCTLCGVVAGPPGSSRASFSSVTPVGRFLTGNYVQNLTSFQC